MESVESVEAMLARWKYQYEEKVRRKKERLRELKKNRRTKAGRRLERERAKASTRVWSDEEKKHRIILRERWNYLCDNNKSVGSYYYTRNDPRDIQLDPSMKSIRIKWIPDWYLNQRYYKYRIYFQNAMRYTYCCCIIRELDMNGRLTPCHVCGNGVY